MTWSIDYTDTAIKQLAKLDKTTRDRILKFLNNTLLSCNNPRQKGDALTGTELGGLWRYKIGDYRVIAEIIDIEIIVLVVEVGHRSKVYKKK